ncbi:diaminopimelate decarboxylase [Desulfovibrio psychrotolerans]|uniref:Diaminopimelate decarboxylase n=1 Tax=Desulfovibrio psychrotolerans TaxID=415242 RepID=A0A7J0BR11_9BACT|nr:diaminopimelate decarboxylase [Desulfovibrio psychrotolerans]GFM35494.1 diaminopimelate decarboxylase [Desulfovibrio psychrotolerans]
MHHFEYRHNELHAEDIPVRQLAAEYGTPLYVYSSATLTHHFQAFDSAFGTPHLTCYSVKACSNIAILRLLGALGAGVDIVSGGELHRALKAGIAAERIVYSGVGKKREEIRQALQAGILMFNVESMQELESINAVAREMETVARISIRINPDVDPKTHPYISTGLKKNKFGLDLIQARAAYRRASELDCIEPVGIDCHIGSQLTSLAPFLEALDRVLLFCSSLRDEGIQLRYLDLGGGLGIPYNEEDPPHPAEYGNALTERLHGTDITLILEPGRVIAGNAGILVTKVIYTKETPGKNFVIVDAAMNDLVRPSLYQSYHRIAEVSPQGRKSRAVDVVGPICESGDFLAQDRAFPEVRQEELLVLFSAGAYGFSMSSQYNSRPRAAEVLVCGNTSTLIRRRETYDDLTALEENA